MSDPQSADLPVVVIGAGPAGLAAAAQLRSRDVDVVVLEAGDAAGAAVQRVGPRRLFSPWSELIDPVADEAARRRRVGRRPTRSLPHRRRLGRRLPAAARRRPRRLGSLRRDGDRGGQAEPDRLVSSGRDEAALHRARTHRRRRRVTSGPRRHRCLGHLDRTQPARRRRGARNRRSRGRRAHPATASPTCATLTCALGTPASTSSSPEPAHPPRVR